MFAVVVQIRVHLWFRSYSWLRLGRAVFWPSTPVIFPAAASVKRLRRWGRRGRRTGQQPCKRLGIANVVEGGVYFLDLLPKNLTVRFGLQLDGLCEVCYGLIAQVLLG